MAACKAHLDDNNEAEGEDAFESSEEKTSLRDIKVLLKVVQQTFLEMQTENRRMAAKLTELKSSFKKHSTEISSLKTALIKGA